ncbi:S8 family peptidase [Lysobacter cavernae]|uniref:S8 family peptidase n=1 Tax=Lysobacter cavernae TaxID=1685901 RepID=A0ABV7RQS0_9GAMM
MKKSTRILSTGALATAVIAALSAFASGYTTSPIVSSTASVGAATGSSAAQGTSPGTKVMLASTPQQTNFNRFIVKYKDGAVAQRSQSAALSALNAAATRAGVAGMKAGANGVSTALTLQHVRKLAIGADVIRLSRGLNQTEADALLAQLRSDPAVQYAQPDYIKYRSDFIPNDNRFDLQWHYTNAASGIRAPKAWDTSTGEGVVVAVLDTGYVDHSDLDANIVPGYDFIAAYGQDANNPDIAGDGDGRDADAHDTGDWTDASMPWCGRNSSSSFHGTHVAGTVAAVTNNGIGVAGVAFNAKVQPVRVLGHCGGFTSDIADAITWASGGTVAGAPDNSANHAEVLNLSLGGSGSCGNDTVTQAAVDGAISRGVTVVVAAGNSNADAANFSPASCKGVITVGANGVDGAKSWFSNYGPTVSVTAPGGNATSGDAPDNAWIWSLGNRGTKAPIAGPEGEALIGNIGTSMASPHVAGIVALMQSAAVAAGNPALTPAQVRTILRQTAKPFTVLPPSSTPMGAGIVDAAAAVAAASQPVPTDEPSVLLVNRQAISGQTGAAGDSLLYMINVPAGTRSLNLRSYGGTGDVSLYVSHEVIPTTVLYGRKSAKTGNAEAVVITNPAQGTWYLRVAGEKAFANVSVMGLY